MTGSKYGWEQYRREEEIKKLTTFSSERIKTIHFNGERVDLKVISVPIELPAYRLENGRTSSAQDQYIASNTGIPEDFFTRDLNSPEAQEIQHSLLLKLVNRSRLEKEFKKTDTHQTEPLICTPEGFVINGNRRLSYWRNLYYNSPDTYPFYKYIEIAIFPYSDEDSILQLEVDLQIAPDIKEDYIWHAEAKMIIRHRDKYGYDSEKLAKIFRKDSKKEVDELLSMYDLAEEFLHKHGITKQWDKVTGQLQAFKDLANYLYSKKAFTSDAHATVFKNIGFSYIKLAIDNNLDGNSAHKNIVNAKKYYPNVEAVLLTNYASQVESITAASGTEPDVISLLENGFVSNQEQGRLAALTQILESGNRDHEIASMVTDAVEEQQEIQKEKKRNTSVFSYIKDAHGKLESAIAAIANNSSGYNLSKAGVNAQLDNIETCIHQLKVWLSE